MALIELRISPSARDLRWFGLILLALFGLVGVLVWRATGSLAWPQLFWAAALVLTLAYYVVKPLQRPMYVGWSYVTYPIGWVISHALMATVYFVLFTAVGALMRLFGYDPLARAFDRSATTYWVRREDQSDVSHYFRQY
jgi:hypothetical protein